MQDLPGFWRSSWSAELAAQASAELMELKATEQAVYWTEYSPIDGRTLLYSADFIQRQPVLLTCEDYSVRSRVNEYGGGAFSVIDDLHWLFINEADQQIYLQRRVALSQPQPITDYPHCRYAEPLYDSAQHCLIAIEQAEEAARVVHRLVCLRLDAQFKLVARQVLQQSADFYSSPVLSADGLRLAWIEWDRPDQPWTQTRLLLAERAAVSTPWFDPGVTIKTIAGEQGDAALQQPRFNGQQLFALNDQAGYWEPWAEQSDSRFVQLTQLQADMAGAPWQMGGCNYWPLDQNQLLITWFEQGFGHCGIYSLSTHSMTQQLFNSASRIRHLAVTAEYIIAIASYSQAGSAVMLWHRASATEHCIKQLSIGLNSSDIATPEPLHISTSAGKTTHAFLFKAKNSAYSLPDSAQLTPLVVFLHGGPTSAAYPVFDPRIQFWTQRGFAVVDINYCGSTGFGRTYRYALQQRWGEAEIADIAAVVDYVIEHAAINPAQVVIRGASAGGYSALMAVAKLPIFAAAASWYGVTDPLNLRQATHKFEGDYLDWLLGDPQQARDYYQTHSPIYLADQIQTPLIFFQGALDVVVVPEQTQSMWQQLQRNQVLTEYYEYPNQGHGFRDSQILADALQRELAFYQRLFIQATG